MKWISSTRLYTIGKKKQRWYDLLPFEMETAKGRTYDVAYDLLTRDNRFHWQLYRCNRHCIDCTVNLTVFLKKKNWVSLSPPKRRPWDPWVRRGIGWCEPAASVPEEVWLSNESVELGYTLNCIRSELRRLSSSQAPINVYTLAVKRELAPDRIKSSDLN